MRVRVLLYKSKLRDGHYIDNGISFWTKLFNWRTRNYSHVELWMPDKMGWFTGVKVDNNKMFVFGTCFTSTMGQVGGRKGAGGTCIRPVSDILNHPDRWDYQEIECTDGQYKALQIACDLMVKFNKGYDMSAIVSFFNPFGRYPCKQDMYICSEAVWVALWKAGILVDRKLFSPRRMSRKVAQYIFSGCKLGEIKEL